MSEQPQPQRMQQMMPEEDGGWHRVDAGEHVGAAVDALIEYWMAEQEKINDEYGDGVHCEVHEGSVHDGYGWKALPWQPGDPVIDLEPEAQRKLLRK